MNDQLISKNAYIGPNVTIFPNVFIGDNVHIGEGTTIQYGAYIEKDCVIGENSRIGTNAVLRRETHIGDRTVFGSLSASEGKNWIGNDVLVHSQCHLTTGLIVEDCVFMAPFFVGANDPDMLHKRRHVKPFFPQASRIKFGARLAVGVTVNPGVTIGREAVIGSGSTVTRSVDDYMVAFGSPAKIKGHISESFGSEHMLSEERFLSFQERISEKELLSLMDEMLEDF